MLVVADTSPLNYLILIDLIDLLPRLYGEIAVPQAVMHELQQLPADLLLIDDQAGRRAALRAGLRVAGTLAVLERCSFARNAGSTGRSRTA